MNEAFFGNAGYVIALTACFAGAYLWKQTKRLAQELEAQRLQVQNEKAAQGALKESTANSEKLLGLKEKELQQREKAHSELEKAYRKLETEFGNAQKNILDLRTLENNLDHYKSQTETLLAQVQELDAENSLLKKSAAKELSEKTGVLTQSVQSLSEETKKQQLQRAQLESQVTHLQTRLSELQVEEQQKKEWMIRLKRKAYQADHLYKTIRGQKEMLDERLENWEKALRLLATWVLQEHGQDLNPNASLGEIVSAALQVSKQGPLMTDDVDIAEPTVIAESVIHPVAVPASEEAVRV